MTLRRVTMAVGLLLYIFLWLLVFNGATSLLPIVVVPLVLWFVIVVGVALTKFIGIKPRESHFESKDDEQPQN
jgi:fatty acid desaturase